MTRFRAALRDGVARVRFEIGTADNFEGRFRPKTKIQFYAPLRDPVSMANVSNRICHSLTCITDDIAIQSYLSGGWFDSSLEEFKGLNTGSKIGIFFGIPERVPELFFLHPIKIGCFVCETDRIESTWVKICNRFDLIIVPSHWCRNAFIQSGVLRPVMVVPHGVEREYRPYCEKSLSTPFVFYNTFYAVSLHQRKSLEELVRCFLKAFQGRDDVVLRLRTDNKDKLGELSVLPGFDQLIQVEPVEGLSTKAFARIYSEVHCTVHPSKGEGFGMIPFQSIACETPVIAPHATGMADYLTPENSIALNTSSRVAGETAGNSAGTYYSIDEDHLVHCLRYAVDNWDEEYRKVQVAGPVFRETWRWDNVLGPFNNLVRELLSCNSDDDSKAILGSIPI